VVPREGGSDVSAEVNEEMRRSIEILERSCFEQGFGGEEEEQVKNVSIFISAFVRLFIISF
jgi:hypothetical protein